MSTHFIPNEKQKVDMLAICTMLDPTQGFDDSWREKAGIIMQQLGGAANAERIIRQGGKKPFNVVPGQYHCGGLFIKFESGKAKDNGFGLVISNRFDEDYTLTYFIMVNEAPKYYEIISGIERIYCDQLTDMFTLTTGIEIPFIDFGPIVRIIAISNDSFKGRVEMFRDKTEVEVVLLCPWADTIDTAEDGTIMAFELKEDHHIWVQGQ